MYVIIRTMKIEKGYLDRFKENFLKDSPITKSPGFVKKELYVSTKDKDFDILKNHIFFADKKAYYIWQGSPAHIALHREKKENPGVKPEGVIEVSKEEYELVLSQTGE